MRALLLVLAGCGRFGFDAVGEERLPDPVARYLFDDDPGDGVADETGNHDAVCDAACPVRTAAVDGQGYLFANEVLRVPAVGELAAFDALSVAVWLRVDAMGDTMCMVGAPLGVAVENSWQACLTGALDLIACAGGCEFSDVFELFEVGEWNHLTLVWDGATLRSWINGRPVIDSAQTAVELDGQDVLIGKDLDNQVLVAPFVGVLDDLRIWNVALTEDQVISLVDPPR